MINKRRQKTNNINKTIHFGRQSETKAKLSYVNNPQTKAENKQLHTSRQQCFYNIK